MIQKLELTNTVMEELSLNDASEITGGVSIRTGLLELGITLVGGPLLGLAFHIGYGVAAVAG